ncbi:MAG: TIM barrel protein [Acidobacteriia bacterium]|nr:TIM barrel protein [Terriglobia bacterium]
MKTSASSLSRRAVLGMSAGAAVSLAAPVDPGHKLQVCAFSKHFHWLNVREASQLAASIGYDGLDLTVRKDGHVEPERVADDLPKAVQAILASGLKAPMITAGIVDVGSPHAEAILKTASALGIKRYRWGGFRYDTSKSIPQQIREFQAQSRDLAAMNKRYGVCAMYHTHSGVGQFGASMWDIWSVLKDLDTSAVSVNLDIGHATVEGGLGGWVNTSRLLLPISKGIAVKDFRWEKNAAGKWSPRWCGLGQGMVDFPQFFAMLKTSGFDGPLQLHMEYPELGDAHSGKKRMSIPKVEFVSLMKRDLAVLRGLLKEGGLA